MNKDAKLCLIGGGGVRTPFVAKTIATLASSTGIKELTLFDIDEFKLAKIGSIAKEIAKRIDPNLKVSLEVDPETALANSDYIITTVRAGGDRARRQDEQIVSKYGLLAQETTGACGFAMAMRSIPVILEYCEIARKVAKPNHLIFNFTNPAGLVTQALTQAGYQAIGICDTPAELMRQLADLLEVQESQFSFNSFGLNHLSWFNQFKVDGVDVSELVINHPDLFTKTEMRLFEQDILLSTDNHLLNEYLYFYLYTKRAIRLSNESNKTRGELILQVNQSMNAQLTEVDVDSDFDKALKIFFDNYNVRENSYLTTESGIARVKQYRTPSTEEFITMPDQGGYAGVALRLIHALSASHPTQMVLSVPNNGAIPQLAADDVIEVSCTISNGKITPNQQLGIPDHILDLILAIKEYERLAIEAISKSSTELAIKALETNPLVADRKIATHVVADFVAAYGGYGGPWR